MNKLTTRYRHAPPKASAMIEALRGLGYNIATALADIIDNSISAGSHNISLSFFWNGDYSHITILDDGCGMNAKEIDTAMRLGEKNPLEKRNSTDLGRFGLGLKTASFSQCRKLTVATIGSDGLQCLRWDLNILTSDGNDDGWYMLEGVGEGSESIINTLIEQNKGTLVLWEDLDRIITKNYKEKDFLTAIDEVESHLAMTFHRFIEGNNPQLKISINGKLIRGWDPYLSGHLSKSWESPLFPLPGCLDTKMQCHVLPHKDYLSEAEYLKYEGPNGWTAQQGFYIYRNKRLLVAGSWLGLGNGRSWTKDEAHKLARIRLDIPNTSDVDWKIDIRKSKAHPPISIRFALIKLAEETRSKARKAFAHRGKYTKEDNNPSLEYVWKAIHNIEGVRYKIDLDHPAVRGVIDDAGGLLPQVKAMLRIIEETVPIQKIWLDTEENKEVPRNDFSNEPTDEIISVLKVLYTNMINKKGFTSEIARKKLSETEPFNKYPELFDNAFFHERIEK
jgi:anti-sigma regulatory factor (Ser/Thr protein kinase)